jgi:DNA-binding FrmR family transcriptional regulator
MKMSQVPKAAVPDTETPRTHKRNIEERLEKLDQRILRILRLVEADQDYLDITKETNLVQEMLKQLSLLLVSERMDVCFSSLSFPKKERDRLIDEITHVLSRP